jgi:hypothetical protein
MMRVGNVHPFTWDYLLIGGCKYFHAFSSVQEILSFVILTPPTLNGHIFFILQPLQVVIQMAMYAQLQALQHPLKLQKQ